MIYQKPALELLTNKHQFFTRLLDTAPERQTVRSMLATSLVSFLLFGALLGAFHSPLQAVASALKLPLLFLGTSIVCFPTLYAFLATMGIRHNVRQLLAFCLASISLTGLSLLAFAPVSFFFLLTDNSYVVYKMVNILILAVSGSLGMYTFYTNLNKTISRVEPEKDRRWGSVHPGKPFCGPVGVVVW